MSKFSDKVVDGLSLVAEKVDENKFLGAIKDSFTIYMPFVIVGSFMSLFNTILCSTTTGLAQWIPTLTALAPIFTAANFATLSCITAAGGAAADHDGFPEVQRPGPSGP